jgi:prepilin-type N-terminal cleavage/methylation domain-containing protein
MRRGFTLVELLISLTLLAMLLGGLLYALCGGLRNWRKISGRAVTLQIENIVAERLSSDVRGSAIMTGSTSTELFLQLGPDTVSYKLEAGKVRRKKGSSTAYWTSQGEIKALTFSYPAANQVLIGLDGSSCLVGGRGQ